MTKEQENAIFNALLDSDWSTRYWSKMARDYQKRDTWINIGVALLSSGAVASWAVWSFFPFAWQTLSMFAACVSIAQPLLNFGGKVEQMFQAQSKWREFEMSYQQLWDNLSNMSGGEAFEKFQEIQRGQGALASECARLPESSDKTKLKIKQDVLDSRGLSNS